MRGNPCQTQRTTVCTGSIPTCAGEPTLEAGPGDIHKVYPHVCGGTIIIPSAMRSTPGLSPRVRGNHPQGQREPDPQRSIPTCAGEPMTVSDRSPASRVYPHVCGGTLGGRMRTSGHRVYPHVCGGTGEPAVSRHANSGLSPRVRGNRGAGAQGFDDVGSIPTCAGEPLTSSARSRAGRVYPHVCGGTPSRIKIKWHIWPLVCINQY